MLNPNSTLEDVLQALYQKLWKVNVWCAPVWMTKEHTILIWHKYKWSPRELIDWKDNLQFSQQSQETQDTINKLLENTI